MSTLGNKQIMAANIRRHMKIAGVTPKEVCTFLQIPMPTFSDWINAKTYPRIDKIEMLANYFGVTKAQLVEKKPALGSKNMTSQDPDIRRIERARKNMSVADKQKMMKILEASFEDYFSDDYVDDDLNE